MKFDFHKNHQLLFGTSALVFIILSAIIAISPAIWAEKENEAIPGLQPLTDRQKRGQVIYVSEGCVYCHTQQLRPLDVDRDYGRPTVPGDSAYNRPIDFWRGTPSVLGSERNGPDLSNIGKRQPSRDWHMIHLYNSRAVVKGSIMPAYKWLFTVKENPKSYETVIHIPEEYAPKKGFVVATEDAEALTDYLLSLKQVELPDNVKQVYPEDIEKNDLGNKNGTQSANTSGNTQEHQAETSNAKGDELYANNCASCHQAEGKGVSGTFPSLVGDPVVTAKDPKEHITIVLNGLQGKAIKGVNYSSMMPAFSQLSDEEITAIINHERTSWGNKAPKATVEQVKLLRAKK